MLTSQIEGAIPGLPDQSAVLAGASAARQLGWAVPDGDWPVELYMAEADLVELVDTHALELTDEGPGDLVLRAVPEPWPFPPHMRVVPDVANLATTSFTRTCSRSDEPRE